jgi:hypothetical protein
MKKIHKAREGTNQTTALRTLQKCTLRTFREKIQHAGLVSNKHWHFNLHKTGLSVWLKY